MTSNCYDLSSANFTKNIQKTYRNLYLDNKFSDVTIVSEDNFQFNAHMFLLASSSEIFEGIFMNVHQKSPIVFLNGIKGLNVKYLLKFLYLGDVSVELSDIESFMQFMKDFKINCPQTSESPKKQRNDNIDKQVDDINCMGKNSGETKYIEVAKNNQLMKVKDEEIKIEDHNFSEEHKEEKVNKTENKKAKKKYWILDEEIQCNECEYKTNRKYAMKHHVQNRHQNHARVRYPCDQCGQTYSFLGSLKTHISSQHSGLNEVLNCKIEGCSFTCKRKQWMNVHEIGAHNLGSKLNCDQCGYVTANKANFKNHLRTQHSDFFLKCDKCEYQCKRKDILKDHIRAEHENIVHPCEFCDYRATKKENLREHMQVKHIKKILNCENCEFKTIYQRKLGNHNRLQHGKKSSQEKAYPNS